MQNKIDEKVEELRKELGEEREQELGEAEMNVLTRKFSLPDAIREGATVTGQSCGWGDGHRNACAFTAAYLSVRARGMVD